ncbi:MAG: translation initiation factor IF-2 [Endomicrobiales bacterium]|nr:translation initiation factor IF-2 [Endomicrobiales bacterium]
MVQKKTKPTAKKTDSKKKTSKKKKDLEAVEEKLLETKEKETESAEVKKRGRKKSAETEAVKKVKTTGRKKKTVVKEKAAEKTEPKKKKKAVAKKEKSPKMLVPEVKEERIEIHREIEYREEVKKESPVTVKEPAVKKYKGEIRVNELTTVREIAEKMKLNPGDIIKKLLSMGTLVTINQRLDLSTVEILANEYSYEVKYVSIYEGEEIKEEEEDQSKLKPRSAVVTIMGHVDHGKTSLLDAIRETDVAGGEAGGITQHIGAYKVKTKNGDINFLDTPGHEAFTSMRARGAQATDIVVLVVAADDGVMPQTVEAIDHAKAANVPIIVAINKTDVPGANPAQVKQELTKYNLVPEDWGGDTITVEVSAKNKVNIDQLLEMILLKAEMMELKANPDNLARGVVVEARLDQRKGPVMTVLVQKGTLRVGDNYIVGTTCGKVRAMTDEHGHRLQEAPPVTPVEILGVSSTPHSGDRFIAVESERYAREIAQNRQNRAREEALRPRHHLSLEDISSGKVKELRLIIKADVQGSLEALRDSLEKFSTKEITLRVVHGGVGTINESDITLAAASDALIVGFNIRPEPAIQRMAEKEGVSIQIYRIIYEVTKDIRAAMEGLLEPKLKEIVLGRVQVKQVFKVSKVGTIAGCQVAEGKVQRGCKIRLLRDNVIVYDGSISSLRRFKDDVKEVDKGYECGIGLDKFSDVKSGDIFEVYSFEKIARKLEE